MTAPNGAPGTGLDAPGATALRDALRRFVEQADGEGRFCVRTVTAHAVRSLEVDTPLLALPLQGRKRLADAHGEVQGEAGRLLLVPGARQTDSEHIPDPRSGPYQAVVIPVPQEVTDAARPLWQQPLPDHPGPVAALPWDEGLVQALSAWLAAHQSGRALQQRHALLGVVLALCERGHSGLLVPVDLRWSARVHRLVAAAPARDWSSADIEQALAVSGATLRRRLSEEGTQLRQVLSQARLACALQLLYATRLPVKTVAQRVGYASVSAFSKRFAERYGLEPSRIGQAAAPATP